MRNKTIPRGPWKWLPWKRPAFFPRADVMDENGKVHAFQRRMKNANNRPPVSRTIGFSGKNTPSRAESRKRILTIATWTENKVTREKILKKIEIVEGKIESVLRYVSGRRKGENEERGIKADIKYEWNALDFPAFEEREKARLFPRFFFRFPLGVMACPLVALLIANNFLLKSNKLYKLIPNETSESANLKRKKAKPKSTTGTTKYKAQIRHLGKKCWRVGKRERAPWGKSVPLRRRKLVGKSNIPSHSIIIFHKNVFLLPPGQKSLQAHLPLNGRAIFLSSRSLFSSRKRC